jgi:hypothetical protein
MKFNIFARLNNLEQALGDKQKALQVMQNTLEATQNSIEKLSDLVVFQGKVIGHLNRYAKFYPEQMAKTPQPDIAKPEAKKEPIKQKEGDTKTETPKERMKRLQREWYIKNKEALAERRKLVYKKQKITEAQKRAAKKYYENNKEKVKLRSRANYLKRKAERAAKEQA